jgi:NAD(P)-dependent dehydrogenase (short-subunit alcohol dehydrogenase family)
VALAADRFGHLNAAAQVADIAHFAPFREVTDASWQRILDVNLKGAWYLVQEAGRAMVRQGTRGAIVVTSSTNAFQPEAGGLAYNTSKSGQVAVMRTAAMKLAAAAGDHPSSVSMVERACGRSLASARQQLGSDRTEIAWEEGWSMDFELAVEDALGGVRAIEVGRPP